MSYTIHAEADSDAPPSVVFDLLAHVETWPSWSKASAGTRERSAPTGDPDGVGSIRVLQTGRTTSREEILEFAPGRRSSYSLLSGLPLRDYRADVDLTARPDGGTHIVWHSAFSSARFGTGWLYRSILQRFIARTARMLAEASGRATVRDRG
jgi:hypothetical protein